MEQKNWSAEKNVDQRFEAQSEMIKSVVHDLCALLIEKLKVIFKEIKKERNRWKGKFWKAYASATNNITEASESADSKRLGRAQTIG